MPQPLDNLASELRGAVLANDNAQVLRLSAAYTEALREHWIQLSAPARAASPIPKQSIELLTWVREMTIMQHALASEHLSVVERASRSLTARALYLQSAALDAER
jgi:ferric iron reductase protein FhuF